MKKTVAAGGDGDSSGGGGGGGDRKSLRNRRRRVLDDDRSPPPPPPAATITSGALLRLQTVQDARDPSATTVTDDWLFADWLDSSGGGGTAVVAPGTYVASVYIHPHDTNSPPPTLRPFFANNRIPNPANGRLLHHDAKT